MTMNPTADDFNGMLSKLTLLEAQLGDEHLAVAGQLVSIGLHLYDHGGYSQALEYYHRALSIRQSVLGEADVTVAQVHYYLGRNWYELEEHELAGDHLQKSLDIYEGKPAANDDFLAEILDAKAYLHHDRDQFWICEKLLLRAFELRAHQLEKDDPRLAESANHLGWLYAQHGLFERAELLFTQALDIFQKYYGPNHASTTRCLENLADMLQKTGRQNEASHIVAQVEHIRFINRQS